MYMGFSNIYAYTYVYTYIQYIQYTLYGCVGNLLSVGSFCRFYPHGFSASCSSTVQSWRKKICFVQVVELLSWKLWLHAEIEHRRFIFLQSIREEHTHNILSIRNHHLDIWSSHLFSTHKYDTCRLKSTCNSTLPKTNIAPAWKPS